MALLPPEFSPFMSAWDNLPRQVNPVVPHKKDISPALFGEFLHLVCVTEMVARRHLKILFVGSEFERLAGFGADLENYYDMLPAKFMAQTEIFHDIVLGTPCGAFIGDVITTTSGVCYLHETVHLPLADADGEVRYLMVYGVGRKPTSDYSPRSTGNHNESNIKELRYLDLGAGAPADRIRDFRFHRATA